jgi:tRNA dimethylallyltransferase
MTPSKPEEARPPGPVVVVTGPTASGKTKLAIDLAQRFDGEIINADSMQVFRYMDIGSAKPTLEERASVPHHLFDIVTPDVEYSAGLYAEDSRRAADEIQDRGKTVFLAGGTGLYIRAFLQGLVSTGSVPLELRERLEREHAQAVASDDPQRMYRRLVEIDPDAAKEIHPNDVRRTLRALEIMEIAGEAASKVRDDHAFADRPFAALHLAIDPGREVVAERIDQRCKAMIDAGLLQEVRALRERGYGPELRPMQSIGYRHINPVVEGHETLVGALESMRVDTRRFARRQRTWLRKVEDALWLDPGAEATIFECVERFLEDPGAERAPESGSEQEGE